MDIYAHDDFRKVLAELYEERKASVPGYSTRKFCQETGLTNPGYLGDVLKGRRKLSESAQEKMLAIFPLKPQEADFFRLLVKFAQCKRVSLKEEYWRQILSRRSRSNFARLNPGLTRYYQDYRYPLVRTALECCDFRGDYAALAQFVDPPMPVSAVQKCVRDLCEWGLVLQEPTGRYVVTETFVEPPTTMNAALRALQRTWVTQGGEAIARIPPAKRHISTILLSVSDEAQQKIRQRLEAFREDIFALLRDDKEPTRVMQLSMQYFPRTRLPGAKK
jgi:uncharacterized protein (TIGR02147 family)